ncbi:hypothetical protein WN51_13350 [Melipona quadrifasciata]|uniref:Uncharacterized protein n=1 Tax=Melipona quadrifasciata TaxID=166423 RepID=A0A0M9A3T0_9HYME|nr:hypothetical protein WN51_13350 [Melipona quadrifasciata]
MRQSTVKGFVCLEQSPALWPKVSGDAGLLRRPRISQIRVSNTRLVQAASGCAPSVDVLPIFDVKQQSVRNPARMGANQPRGFPLVVVLCCESEPYSSEVKLILTCKLKESTDALSVPSPLASENRRPRVGTKVGCTLPSWVIFRARVSHVFGKVGSMLQSTVEDSAQNKGQPDGQGFVATQACSGHLKTHKLSPTRPDSGSCKDSSSISVSYNNADSQHTDFKYNYGYTD